VSEAPRAAHAMALLCAATVVFLAARDLFLPEIGDVEVWLGFELHGRAARLTAPLHWAIFAGGAFAFWRGSPWAWTAAAGYVFYVALSHLVWSEASPHGQGWPMGLLQAAGISAVGLAVLWLGRRATARRASASPLR
jgi:hypothetical protein